MCNNKMEIVQKYCRLHQKFWTASGANRWRGNLKEKWGKGQGVRAKRPGNIWLSCLLGLANWALYNGRWCTSLLVLDPVLTVNLSRNCLEKYEWVFTYFWMGEIAWIVVRGYLFIEALFYGHKKCVCCWYSMGSAKK